MFEKVEKEVKLVESVGEKERWLVESVFGGWDCDRVDEKERWVDESVFGGQDKVSVEEWVGCKDLGADSEHIDFPTDNCIVFGLIGSCNN